MPQIQYRQAIRDAMSEEMRRDPNVFLMGEEVAQYDGAYKVSQGMLEEFGEDRVIDTPISEAGFSGLGLGASMLGLRPIIEFMSFSFTMVAIDQIVNNGHSVRYMSGGQISCPIVFRGLSGAGQQLGATHSHRLEAWYANVPGLKVVMPATPYDAKGLMKTAIRDDNPVIFMEGQSLYNVKGEVPDEDYTVPFGKANVAREGSDLTIVTYHQSLQPSLDAAEKLAEDGLDVEVIDLRSIRPLDEEAILKSVAKTHRAMVVEADWYFCGIGSQMADLIQSQAFDELDAPVGRVTAMDTPLPYNKVLELDHVLPNVRRITEAAAELLNREPVGA